MKKSGLLRIDEVGRIVLPKDMRKLLKLDRDRLVELYVEKDRLIIKKYSPIASAVERAKCICKKLASETGCICIVTDTSKILCVSGEALKGIEGKKISPSFYSLIENTSPVLINSEEGGKPLSPCGDPEIEYSGLAAVVLEQEDCPIGAVALMCADKTRRLGDLEVTVLKIAKELLCSCCSE